MRTWNGNVGRKEAGNPCSWPQQANGIPAKHVPFLPLTPLIYDCFDIVSTYKVAKEKNAFLFSNFLRSTCFLTLGKLLADNFICADNVSRSYPTHIMHSSLLDLPDFLLLCPPPSFSSLLLLPPSSSLLLLLTLFIRHSVQLNLSACKGTWVDHQQPHSSREMGASSRIHQLPLAPQSGAVVGCLIIPSLICDRILACQISRKSRADRNSCFEFTSVMACMSRKSISHSPCP